MKGGKQRTKEGAAKPAARQIPAPKETETVKGPAEKNPDPANAPLKHGLMHSLFTKPRPGKAELPAEGAIHLDRDNSEAARSMRRMYRRLTAAMPAGLVSHFEKKMRLAGINEDQRTVAFGRAMLVSFLAGALPLMLYLAVFNPMTSPATATIAISLFLGGILASLILHYLSLYFSIADRTAAVEKMLPDFLSLAVSNLRAGMSPYAAFVHAARPEFGAFHDAVVLSMARMGGKGSIAEALMDVSENFDSPILRRTVTLFAKGVRSGGQLVRLLNSSADEVRRIQDLRAELIASTRTYSIFLSFIVILVMPFLLAVSTNFVMVFVKLEAETGGQSTNMPAGAQMPSFSGKILITTDDMQNISILTLVVIDLMVSILIGVIDKGKAIYGVKSFPVLVILSILAFTFAKAFIGSFLSGFMI